MPHTHTSRRRPAAAALAVLMLACIGLTACGSSTSTTSSSANAAATATTSSTSPTGTSSTGSGTTTTPATKSGPARFAAIRECLQKNGVTLPARTPGSRGPRGGGFMGGAGGGRSLPKGVTRAQYEAALKKCGGGRFAAAGPGLRRTNNPAFSTALGKFAECLRQNGVNLPAPNTSGNGPIFNTKGVDTSSPQFKSAEVKCRSTLIAAFRRPRSAGGTSGASAPPSSPEASR